MRLRDYAWLLGYVALYLILLAVYGGRRQPGHDAPHLWEWQESMSGVFPRSLER